VALRKEDIIIWIIYLFLLVLGVMGLFTDYMMGHVIFALLVCAAIMTLIQLIEGRRRA